MNSSVLRFAFVGCGGIARHHLKALQGCGQAAQVVAAVDTRKDNAEAFASIMPGHCQVRWAGLLATLCNLVTCRYFLLCLTSCHGVGLMQQC